MKTYISFLLLLTFSDAYPQSDVPLTLLDQFNGSFGYTIIGNTHNSNDNVITPTAQCQLLTASSATLNLLPSQTIVAAYLHWGGIGDGTLNQTILLNGINYISIDTDVGYPENNFVVSYFSSVANITNQVISQGNGNYTFSNFDLNTLLSNYCSNGNYVAGWHIIVIFTDTTLPNNQINIYKGINICSFFFNNGITPLSINSLNVVDTQNAKMTYVGLNGSSNVFLNESITINGNILSNNLNPPDNPFNGTNSFTGSTTNWNQDIDTFDISPYINLGDSQAQLSFNSFYYRFIQTVVTSIRSELPDATVTISQVSGQETCNNRNLIINYTVSNTNSNAALPANVPVSFYANGAFLQTAIVPSSIDVGGSLALQTTITIPLSIPNSFTLKIVADNTIATVSQVAESNESNNENSQIIALTSGTLITPSFAPISAICSGEVLAALPTVSTNGILGSWSPIINNTASTTYTFLPLMGQCALSTTMTILVNAFITPDFQEVSLCENDITFSLNTTSPNGVFGSWLPSIIDNQNSGSYVFSPSDGQCAIAQSIFITINPNTLTNFEWIITHPFATYATITISTTSLGNYLYQLDLGPLQTSSIFENVSSGLHTLTVYQQDGCFNSITKQGILIIKYPLFFTPNNDGFNDTWNISDLFLQPDTEIFIYDRYGKLLKQISTVGLGWDGTYNGKEMPADDYWFTVTYQFDDFQKRFSSHFALKR